MNSDIKDIITKLKEGDVTPKKAVSLIKSYNYPEPIKGPRASKLKITIYSKDDNKTIRIPSIPFWLITSLGNAGLKLSKFIASRSNTIDDETKKYLSILDDFDLREVFQEFRNHGPFDFVNVDEKDGDQVRISIL